MNIVIAGGSGFIGTTLCKALLSKGHTVIVVDVIAPSFTHEALFFIQCDLANQALPYNILERTDAVINLCGVSLNKKWTLAYKRKIYDSRIKSTRAIVAAIASAQTRPTVFISASATGFYGDTDGTLVDERSPKGEGFLAEVVSDWENEALNAQEYGVRTVLVRTAPVLGRAGLLRLITLWRKAGILFKLRKDDPWMAWIHELDIIRIYLYALETQTLLGPVNAVSPSSVTQNEFLQTLKEVLGQKLVLRIPQFILASRFKDMIKERMQSTRVMPQRLIDKGFEFKFESLKDALLDIFNSHNHSL